MALAAWPGHGHALESWEKEAGSPVSAADLAVDAFLRRELSALLPAAGWLSEETADAPERLAGGLIWLVDPIDGTRDFIRGRDGWAVSVALISSGRPLFGLLDAPNSGWARPARAHGAMANGWWPAPGNSFRARGFRPITCPRSMPTWSWSTSPIRLR